MKAENMVVQATLSAEQIEAFYHDEFVDDQVRDFCSMLGGESDGKVVVDIGGGCGFFAKRLAEKAGERTRVIDMDSRSIEECRRSGVDGRIGDALSPGVEGDEGVVTFNLILHHLIGSNEKETRQLQLGALKPWIGKTKYVFVNEYIYQSWIKNLSGRLIYNITSSRILSFIARIISKIIPAFKANTFGVGVRFRSHDEWCRIFSEAGYRVADSRIGQPEHISPPLRVLMIKTIRRDSFVLVPA